MLYWNVIKIKSKIDKLRLIKTDVVLKYDFDAVFANVTTV